MSDKPLSRRALRPRRSGERTMRHGAPAVADAFIHEGERVVPLHVSGVELLDVVRVDGQAEALGRGSWTLGSESPLSEGNLDPSSISPTR